MPGSESRTRKKDQRRGREGGTEGVLSVHEHEEPFDREIERKGMTGRTKKERRKPLLSKARKANARRNGGGENYT